MSFKNKDRVLFFLFCLFLRFQAGTTQTTSDNDADVTIHDLNLNSQEYEREAWTVIAFLAILLCILLTCVTLLPIDRPSCIQRVFNRRKGDALPEGNWLKVETLPTYGSMNH